MGKEGKNMKLSIFALQLYLEEFGGDKDKALDYAKSRGISTVEIFAEELEDITLRDYCRLAARHGISIESVIKVSSFPSKSEAEYQQEISSIHALVDDAADAGISMMMIVPTADYIRNEEDKRFMRDRIIQGLGNIVQYAKQKGVTILAENFSRADYPLGTIAELRDILEHVPDLKYNFDTGNFYFSGTDVLDAYEALKDRMVDVHIKDWILDKNGEFTVGPQSFNGCAIGDGFLPMKEIISRLVRDGYAGQLVIEINPVAETTQMIDQSVAFIKEQLER